MEGEGKGEIERVALEGEERRKYRMNENKAPPLFLPFVPRSVVSAKAKSEAWKPVPWLIDSLRTTSSDTVRKIVV